jgi:hypothetical protein
LTFEDAVAWFKANYEQTPTYRIDFTSPYDGTRIEWYYSLSSRVARSGNCVVSYVDYADQRPDKYLRNYSPIIWASPPSPTNSIDNSLSFKVDALGGGYLRAPVSSGSVPYDGDLASFGMYYAEFISANSRAQQVFAFGSVLFVASSAIAAVIFLIRRKRLLSKERT